MHAPQLDLANAFELVESDPDVLGDLAHFLHREPLAPERHRGDSNESELVVDEGSDGSRRELGCEVDHAVSNALPHVREILLGKVVGGVGMYHGDACLRVGPDVVYQR